ncbi:MAG: hypothetical protein DMG11_07720 [Acidobacteria bacterium]|nr:MAG: hypothetical protein DMG11_07720 [Acidobacteriota bacterium]
MTDLEFFSSRLAQVEKQNRRIKQVLLLAVIAIGGLGIMGQGQRQPGQELRILLQDSAEKRASAERSVVEDLVRARQFVLVDQSGKDRASLVTDAAGSVFLIMFDRNGKPRADLSVGNFGPSLTFLDPTGQARAVFGSTMLVGSHVSDNGAVERTPASSIVLLDRNGKLLWRQP